MFLNNSVGKWTFTGNAEAYMVNAWNLPSTSGMEEYFRCKDNAGGIRFYANQGNFGLVKYATAFNESTVTNVWELKPANIKELGFANDLTNTSPHYQPFRFYQTYGGNNFIFYLNKKGINMEAWGQTRTLNWPTPFN